MRKVNKNHKNPEPDHVYLFLYTIIIRFHCKTFFSLPPAFPYPCCMRLQNYCCKFFHQQVFFSLSPSLVLQRKEISMLLYLFSPFFYLFVFYFCVNCIHHLILIFFFIFYSIFFFIFFFFLHLYVVCASSAMEMYENR